MSLSGKTIAFLVAPEGIEQVELTEPWKAVRAGGRHAAARLAPRRARCRPTTTSTRADTFPVDDTLDAAR